MDLNLSKEVLYMLRNATRVAMLTGAGISAESGVPTFRDALTGFWAKFDPYELGSPEGFAKDPQRVWDWYRYRRTLVAAAQPNPGHYAVAEMAEIWPDFLLITQNVDGLHTRAGSKRMLLLHGDLVTVRCNRDANHPHLEWSTAWDVEGAPVPLCECGAMLRPNVVWFGEMLDHKTLAYADKFATECQIFFSVGTSATVQPAALLPIVARGHGAVVIEINTEPTTLTPYADASLLGSAATILPQIVALLRPTNPDA